MVRPSLAVLALVLVATGLAPTTSPDEILDRFYDARGGLKNLKAIESARIWGKYVLVDVLEAPVKMEWKRPDKLRLETVTPQGDTVEAFDGETAWVILPGNEFAQRASGDEATSIRHQADLMDGPLVDWRAKGNSVKYLGEDELDGVPVRKLSLVQSDGTETMIFLDANSFLEIRRRGSQRVQGAERRVETYLGDYKKVGELMIAHTIKTELIDAGLTQLFRIEALELNVDIPDERFTLPAPAP